MKLLLLRFSFELDDIADLNAFIIQEKWMWRWIVSDEDVSIHWPHFEKIARQKTNHFFVKRSHLDSLSTNIIHSSLRG